MRDSLTLGRIAGIQIGVNWSWLVVFALIVWTLYSGIFPETNPGLSDTTYGVMAVVAAALFFASLLLHDRPRSSPGARGWRSTGSRSGSSAASRASRACLEPPAPPSSGSRSPGRSCRSPSGRSSRSRGRRGSRRGGRACSRGSATSTSRYSSSTSSRVAARRRARAPIRAWGAKRDFVWATRLAAAIGRGFGYLFIVGGLALVFFQGAFSGVWIAFMGWFLLRPLCAGDRYLLARRTLGPACAT